jgi:hypothetical protein
MSGRVAKFFLAHHAITVKNTNASLNIPKKLNKIPNGYKIYQRDIKSTKLF